MSLMAHMPATAIDELIALLDDYEPDGPCSCAESALLRWMLRRITQPRHPEDAGIAIDAILRMEEIDAQWRARLSRDEDVPLHRPANLDEMAPRGAS